MDRVCTVLLLLDFGDFPILRAPFEHVAYLRRLLAQHVQALDGPRKGDPVTLLPSASAADASYMVVAADRLDDPAFGVSPELVLVDAALSAEARHLLVLSEDTLGRLERDADRRRCVSQEVAPLSEPTDLSLTEHAHTEFSEGALTLPEGKQHATDSDSEALLPALARKSADPIRRRDVAAQGQQANNTYPALPAPSAESAQEDATDAVLRLITRSA